MVRKASTEWAYKKGYEAAIKGCKELEQIIAPLVAIGFSGWLVYNCAKHVINRIKNERNKQSTSRDK